MIPDYRRRMRSLLGLALIALLLACSRTIATPATPTRGYTTAPTATASTTTPTRGYTTAPTATASTTTPTRAPTTVPSATPSTTPTATPVSPTIPPAQRPTLSREAASRTLTPTPVATSAAGWPWGLIIEGDAKSGVVGLTFDAGGVLPGNTDDVLDTLKRRGIHATFFLTGEWTEANPDLVRRMAADGHELANHTYDHPNLTQVGQEEIRWQLARTEYVVQAACGVRPRHYVRPPFGAYSEPMLKFLIAEGYDVFFWTWDANDWRAEVSVDEIVDWIGKRPKAGDIVIFHCYPPKSAQALPRVLDIWQARQVRCGTLSQALGR